MLLLLAALAFAVPLRLDHQGRLLDSAEAPLTGSHTVTTGLYDAATGGAARFEQSDVVTLDAGYYAVTLGSQSGNALPASLFDGDALYVQISVDGTALPTRQRLAAVPWAIRAAVAEGVDGGDVVADTLTVGGEVLVDANGDFVGEADGDTLMTLTCDADDAAVWTGTAWDCAPNDSFAGLSCPDGRSLAWSGAGWTCAVNDSFAALACTAGQSPVVSGSAWSCAANDSFATLACSDGQHPVRSGSAWACGSDSLGALAAGCLDGDAVVWDDGASAFACAPNTLSTQDVLDAVSSAPLTFSSTVTAPSITLTGPARLGAPDACQGGDDAGKIAWDAGKLVVCDGSTWNAVWPPRRVTLLDVSTDNMDSAHDRFPITIPRGFGTLTVLCNTGSYSSVQVYTVNMGTDAAGTGFTPLYTSQGGELGWGFDNAHRIQAILNPIDKETGSVELDCNSSTTGAGRAQAIWEFYPW